MGWRYLFYTSGALVFVLSILRVVVIRFHETPKFLLCQGLDEDVVKLLEDLARKHNCECDLTVEQLQACGQIHSAHAKNKATFAELAVHVRGLFSTRTLGLSTALVWCSWALIGLGYALYYVYLPEYLASRGAATGQTSPSITWRNYAITNLCAIPGPILAGFMCEMPIFGRKRTMAAGAFITSECFASKRSEAIRANSCSGLLFRIHCGPYRCGKSGLYLCHFRCDQYLLCHFVRLYCRDPPLRASWHRQWHRCCTQPIDGDGFCSYRCIHVDIQLDAYLHLRGFAGYGWHSGATFPS